MAKVNQEPTLSIQLTASDCQNLIAFGNRASMKGNEADLWVALKMKVLQQVQQHAEREKKGFDLVEPDLHAVPDNPGGSE